MQEFYTLKSRADLILGNLSEHPVVSFYIGRDLIKMVLLIVGSSQHGAHMWKQSGIFAKVS